MEEIFRYVVIAPPQKEESPFLLRVEKISRSEFIQELGRLVGANAPSDDILAYIGNWLDSSNVSDPSALLPFHEQLDSLAIRLNQNRFLSFTGLQELITDTFHQSAANLNDTQQFSELRRILCEVIIALTNVPDYRPGLLAKYSNFYRLADILHRVAQNDRTLAGRKIRMALKAILQIPEIFIIKRKSAGSEEGTSADNDAEEESGETENRVKKIEELKKAIEEHRWAVKELGELSSIETEFAGTEDSAHDRVRSTGRSTLRISPSSARSLSDSTREVFRTLEIDPVYRPYGEVMERVRFRLNSLTRELSLLDEPASSSASIMRIGRLSIPASTSSRSPFLPDVTRGMVSDTIIPIPMTSGLVKPAGIGNLYIVKQQIKGYEAGEISHIENILASELRSRETRRLTRTEESLTEEVETITEEERDLQSTERLSMMKETENTLKEDEKFKFGASLSAGYGPYIQIGVNTEYETNTSRETTSRMAQEYAKDVTERTISKLSERIRTERITKTLKEFEDKNKHEFRNNHAESDHIVGIYQWINSVYEAQMFDYGARLFFDIMVPEPALLYIKSLEALKKRDSITPPPPFTIDPRREDSKPLSPDHISVDNYKDLAALYKAPDVEPPPPLYRNISTTFHFDKPIPEQSDEGEIPTATIAKGRTLDIPKDYSAVYYRVSYYGVKGVVIVGNDIITENDWTEKKTVTGNLYDWQFGAINTGAYWTSVGGTAVAAIDVICIRTTAALDEWKIKTFGTLLLAYQKLKAEYEEKIAELEVRQGIEIQGKNPLENRQIERTEIKRGAISAITGQNFKTFQDFPAIPQHSSSWLYTDIKFDRAIKQGRYIRFFEQAFEWDKMYYEFYPYYWGSYGQENGRVGSTWASRVTRSARDANDSQFTEFLNASWCFVRVPVTPEFEEALLRYLETKAIPEGELPGYVLTPEYNKLLSKIYERREPEEEGEGEDEDGVEHEDDLTSREDLIPDEGIPIGKPWELRLPTSLVKLRAEGFSASLPKWKKENGIWRPVEHTD